MQKMGIQALYPKPRTTIGTPGHKIYPYLLRGVEIVRPNQVWSTDITYIPLTSGFMYLVAVIDWYSRFILDWRLSNSLDGLFCIEALEQALTLGRPEIFNSDRAGTLWVQVALGAGRSPALPYPPSESLNYTLSITNLCLFLSLCGLDNGVNYKLASCRILNRRHTVECII